MSAATAVELRSGIRFRTLTACPACGGGRLSTALADGVDFETGLGSFTVRECGSCGIQFTTPQPLAEDVHLLYADRDAHDFETSEGIVDRLRRRNNLRQLRRLPARVLAEAGAALDYGCGSGFFTRTMREVVPGRVLGSDFHDEPPPLIANAADVEYVRDADVDALEGTLGLVVCRNVLEHVVDPRTFIGRMRNLLRPGGVLLIEVPNRRSAWMSILGRYCFNYYLPRHTYHYDAASLDRQLEGFRTIGRWFDHSPILAKSLGYRLGRKLPGLSLTALAVAPVQIAVDGALGRASQLVVAAEKV